MDLIRYALIGGLIFTSITLMTQWQEFNATDLNAEGPVAALSQEGFAQDGLNSDANAEGFDNSSFPQESSTVANSNADLEGLEDTIPGSTNNSAAKIDIAEPVNQGQLISVRTNVLDFRIDPVGGDIIYVSLPKHLAKLEEGSNPFILLNKNSSSTYVAQSGLIGPNATDTSKGRPLFSSKKNSYTLDDNEASLQVDLQYTDNKGIELIKRFTFETDNYLVKVEYLINNKSSTSWKAALYAQIKRDNSADPGADTGGMGMKPFLGFATTSEEDPYLKMSFDDIEEKPYKAEVKNGWLSMVQHYFISAWIPSTDQTTSITSHVTKNKLNIMRMTNPLTIVEPGQQAVIEASFYAGPKDQYVLEEIAKGLDLTVDYGWLWWIAQPLFWLLTMLHKFIGNWGWAIIGLTLLIKLAFFKLSATSYKSMAKMRQVAPKMAELKERYGDDKQKMSQATMELYKKEKINPMGGCLPILVQMPVFISLYWVLMESVELRHAPFMLWIKDLSAMDPYFILPLIMGVSMFVQQKLNPPPSDPMQAKIMQWMPVVFTLLFLWFPAGLVLYWVTNNVLSITQQWVITKQIENADSSKA